MFLRPKMVVNEFALETALPNLRVLLETHDAAVMAREWNPRDVGVVHEVFRLCAVSFGTEADEPLQAIKERHERMRETVENHRETRRRKRVPVSNATRRHARG